MIPVMQVKHSLLLLALLAGNPQSPDVEAEAYRIGRELRCPVCQGMPISESPAQMAVAMMKRVRGMLVEGKSEVEINDYFVSRYGEWVLLSPPAHGFNLLVWILPPLGLLFALGLVVAYARRAGPTATREQAAGAPETIEDSYLERVRREVEN